jgi:hypothetical protein
MATLTHLIAPTSNTRPRSPRRCPSVLVAALLLVGSMVGLRADPLPPTDCDTMRAEHREMLDGDMATDIERGPVWAKDNLAPERLEKMAKLMRLEEQLAFRCAPAQAKGNLLVRRQEPKSPGKTDAGGNGRPIQTGTLKAAKPATKHSQRTTPKRRPKKPAGRDVYVPPPPGLGYRPGGYRP